MPRLTYPTSPNAYSNIDPSTPNAHLHPEPMPKGLRDCEKRVWLKANAEKLKELGKIMRSQYNASGIQLHLTFAEAFEAESKACLLASKRKYIDYAPLLS